MILSYIRRIAHEIGMIIIFLINKIFIIGFSTKNRKFSGFCCFTKTRLANWQASTPDQKPFHRWYYIWIHSYNYIWKSNLTITIVVIIWCIMIGIIPHTWSWVQLGSMENRSFCVQLLGTSGRGGSALGYDRWCWCFEAVCVAPVGLSDLMLGQIKPMPLWDMIEKIGELGIRPCSFGNLSARCYNILVVGDCWCFLAEKSL